MTDINALAKQAADAATDLGMLTTAEKNRVLLKMAEALENSKEAILKVSHDEVETAKANDLAAAMVDRLTLTEERIQDMADGIKKIAELSDPVDSTRSLDEPPSGIQVEKVRIPLGVICMIYEARPNVTADASALCFKSGNAVILRCGKEAIQSSLKIAEVLRKVLKDEGLPEAAITVIPDADRGLMMDLLKQDEHVNLVIPRGGEGLIRFVTENSRIPVIQHYKGVCHLYVDDSADLEMAAKILENGKVQRPGVCNALECVLVHQAVADKFLPVVSNLAKLHGVKINACNRSVGYFDEATELGEDDFGEEYLSLEIAVKIVDDMDGAFAHIDRFGSYHTEVICTRTEANAKLFQKRVDASVVMVNASSRFSDGGQLGLGAEIGIATTKMHAYGPMGLESLTTEKYLVHGEGQIRG